MVQCGLLLRLNPQQNITNSTSLYILMSVFMSTSVSMSVSVPSAPWTTPSIDNLPYGQLAPWTTGPRENSANEKIFYSHLFPQLKDMIVGNNSKFWWDMSILTRLSFFGSLSATYFLITRKFVLLQLFQINLPTFLHTVHRTHGRMQNILVSPNLT